jgi:toxin ParE1/3/4
VADYKFTDVAERDLEEITDYTLQQWGVAQTLAYLDGLEALGQLLADNPDLYPTGYPVKRAAQLSL